MTDTLRHVETGMGGCTPAPTPFASRTGPQVGRLQDQTHAVFLPAIVLLNTTLAPVENHSYMSRYTTRHFSSHEYSLDYSMLRGPPVMRLASPFDLTATSHRSTTMSPDSCRSPRFDPHDSTTSATSCPRFSVSPQPVSSTLTPIATTPQVKAPEYTAPAYVTPHLESLLRLVSLPYRPEMVPNLTDERPLASHSGRLDRYPPTRPAAFSAAGHRPKVAPRLLL